MGKLYDDYLDRKRIAEDMRREQSRQQGRVPCSECGSPSDVRRGTTYAGPVRCRKCLHGDMRIRG